MPTCVILKREFASHEVTILTAIRPQLAVLIKDTHPEVCGDSIISFQALGQFRVEYVQMVLESDVGALTQLEREVVSSMQAHDLVTRDVLQSFESSRTSGEQWSQRIADWAGSWPVIGGILVIMTGWITVNALMGNRALDLYPFLLLNLGLCAVAVLQNSVTIMSQKRQEAKDRLLSNQDYKLSLKMELEIRHMQEKVDYLLKQTAQRLFDLQEIQIDLLQEVAGRNRADKTAVTPSAPSFPTQGNAGGVS